MNRLATGRGITQIAPAGLYLQPWALCLKWEQAHYEEGEPGCTCMLCEGGIGAAENDSRWSSHDPNCTGCSLCELAIRLWRGDGRKTETQRYHEACFQRILAFPASVGPVEPSFTCPRCGRTSHNPNDLANRYCGACHVFVDDPQ